MKKTVRLEKGDGGVITRIDGKVAFPDRRQPSPSPSPKVGDEWEVLVTGENHRKTVFFFRWVKRTICAEEEREHENARRRKAHEEWEKRAREKAKEERKFLLGFFRDGTNITGIVWKSGTDLFFVSQRDGLGDIAEKIYIENSELHLKGYYHMRTHVRKNPHVPQPGECWECRLIGDGKTEWNYAIPIRRIDVPSHLAQESKDAAEWNGISQKEILRRAQVAQEQQAREQRLSCWNETKEHFKSFVVDYEKEGAHDYWVHFHKEFQMDRDIPSDRRPQWWGEVAEEFRHFCEERMDIRFEFASNRIHINLRIADDDEFRGCSAFLGETRLLHTREYNVHTDYTYETLCAIWYRPGIITIHLPYRRELFDLNDVCEQVIPLLYFRETWVRETYTSIEYETSNYSRSRGEQYEN